MPKGTKLCKLIRVLVFTRAGLKPGQSMKPDQVNFTDDLYSERKGKLLSGFV